MSQFSCSVGPDASHWMHTVTLHATYRAALIAYDKATARGWSAAVIRLEDSDFAAGRRVLKRANQANAGHAAAWCDMMNTRPASAVPFQLTPEFQRRKDALYARYVADIPAHNRARLPFVDWLRCSVGKAAAAACGLAG